MNSEVIQIIGAVMILVGAFGFLFTKQRASESFRAIQWLGLSILFFSENQQLGLVTFVMGLLVLGVESVFLTDHSNLSRDSGRMRMVLGIVATALFVAPFILEFPEPRQLGKIDLDWHAYYSGYESVLIRAAFVVLAGIFFLGTLKRGTHE